MFDFIKLMFTIHGYDNAGVAYFVKIGNISKEEYKTITGEEYSEN